MSAKNSSGLMKLATKTIIYLVMFMLLIIMGMQGFKFGQQVFLAKGVDESPGKDVVITIPEGADKSTVADILFSNGLIQNKYIFNIQCTIFEAKFYAGEYTLNTSSYTEDIIERLRTSSASGSGSSDID